MYDFDSKEEVLDEIEEVLEEVGRARFRGNMGKLHRLLRKMRVLRLYVFSYRHQN